MSPAALGATVNPDGQPVPPPVPELSLKTLLRVGLWGATTTLIAYLLSRGSIVFFVVWLFVIAVLVRIVARVVVARRGERPPKGWWYR
jgi:hypothetical protein